MLYPLSYEGTGTARIVARKCRVPSPGRDGRRRYGSLASIGGAYTAGRSPRPALERAAASNGGVRSGYAACFSRDSCAITAIALFRRAPQMSMK
jgi:hypothetical protein